MPKSHPNASGIMTTTPRGVVPFGGRLTYVSRPWILVTSPLGFPSWILPRKQSGQDILLDMLIFLNGSRCYVASTLNWARNIGMGPFRLMLTRSSVCHTTCATPIIFSTRLGPYEQLEFSSIIVFDYTNLNTLLLVRVISPLPLFVGHCRNSRSTYRIHNESV